MTKCQQLDRLYAEMESLAGTLPLTKQPTDIIPGEGNTEARVLLIGEAPGYHEHQQRRPFVGRSGQLLRTVLEEAGTSVASVYISNIVKARPPENRDPTPAEIAAYKPYLDQEIEILSPQLVVTLGRFSMAKFLPKVKISAVHGNTHRVTWNDQMLYVLPQYHPAAALRGTRVMEAFKADIAKIPAVLSWIQTAPAQKRE